jgi:ParB-like chromosome segregation protein Spo0J
MSIPFSSDQFVRGRPTKRVPVAALRPTQVYVDPAKVQRMAKKPGRDLPPVVISSAGDVYDGHHRYSAAQVRKRKTIDAVIF